MKTGQLNIRISEELLQDIDVVSSFLKINRSEWIKMRLAEEAQKEKNKLLMELSTLYAKGMIGKSKVSKLVGKEIADEMEFIKNKTIESAQKGRELGRKLRGKLKR